MNGGYYDKQRRNHGLDTLGDTDRAVLESLAVEALGLNPQQSREIWGRAEGYGLYSTAVIRNNADVLHRYHSEYRLVAVKILHSPAEKIVRFQSEIFHHVWRPPLQRTLHAGITCDKTGKRRGLLVLEFIEGTPLDVLLADGPVSPGFSEVLLRNFFQECLIPLWADGFRFWDFRPANLVVRMPSASLAMIDTDALAAGAEELFTRPNDWIKRNEWEQLAFRRLPRQVATILQAASRRSPRGLRTAAKRVLNASGLAAALHGLGRKGGTAPDEAIQASERIIEEIGKNGL